jgi:hypothetical protein
MKDYERFAHHDPDPFRDEDHERREEARIRRLDAAWGSADTEARKPATRSEEPEPGEETRRIS